MENKIYGYIYLITNIINNKQYVGQTVETVKKRFSGHCSKKIPVISKAIKKYGKENFVIQELAVAYNQTELDLLEGLYMSWFNTLKPNGYNIKKIIDSKGRHSEETKEKIKIIANKPKNKKRLSELGKGFRGKSNGGSSKYCGVYINKYKMYRSSIGFENKKITLGSYINESDAAKAYDIAAIKYFGHDAKLNFPELRKAYINNKVKIETNHSISQEKGIYFRKNENTWEVRWIDINSNKNRSKRFKTLQDAIEFKYSQLNI